MMAARFFVPECGRALTTSSLTRVRHMATLYGMWITSHSLPKVG
jgi:hypothetical protein